MGDFMTFSKTIDEFIKQYKFKDDKEIYTNGSDLIPVFRIKQWIQHMTPALDLITRQQAEIERLKIENEILSINADTAFQDGLNEARDLYAKEVENEIKSEAVKEFAEKFEKKIKDVKFTQGQSWEIQNAFKDIIKETVG